MSGRASVVIPPFSKGNKMSTTDLYAPISKEVNDPPVNLTIRVPQSMREAFSKHCESKGVDVSLVLRRFIEGELSK